MQSELAMAVTKPSGLGERLRRLMGRVLGAEPELSIPNKPNVLHPVEKLTLHNCALFELYRGQPARPYLPLPPIEVVKKISLTELRDGLCEYVFELNAAADGTWRCFFQRLYPSTQARFDNKYLMLVCTPAALEAIYPAVKDAMEIANYWYAEDRDCLIPLVMALDEHRHAQQEMEENRKLGLRNQFEGLPL